MKTKWNKLTGIIKGNANKNEFKQQKLFSTTELIKGFDHKNAIIFIKGTCTTI